MPKNFVGMKLKYKGFTLVEILIGISAAGVIGALLVGFLAQNSRIFSNQNTKVTQGLELNSAVPEIEESIRSAATIASQYPAAGQPQYTSGINTLVLDLPSLNAQGTVIQSTSDYVVFYKDSQNTKILRKKLFPNVLSSRKAENKVLSTKLSKIEFSYLNTNDQSVSPVQASKIGFIINVSDLVSTNTQSSSASGKVNLRNN